MFQITGRKITLQGITEDTYNSKIKSHGFHKATCLKQLVITEVLEGNIIKYFTSNS